MATRQSDGVNPSLQAPEHLSMLGAIVKRMGAIVPGVLANVDETPTRELWTLEDACYSIPAHTLSDAAFLVGAMDHKLSAIIDSAKGDPDVRGFCYDMRAGLYSVLAVLKASGAELDVGIEHLLMPPAENPHLSDAEVWRLRERAGIDRISASKKHSQGINDEVRALIPMVAPALRPKRGKARDAGKAV